MKKWIKEKFARRFGETMTDVYAAFRRGVRESVEDYEREAGVRLVSRDPEDGHVPRVQWRTPCCGYFTGQRRGRRQTSVQRLRVLIERYMPDSPIPRRQAVIMWNPYNGAVQCHNCGATYPLACADAMEAWCDDE